MAWYILGAGSGNTHMSRTNFSHLMWFFSGFSGSASTAMLWGCAST